MTQQATDHSEGLSEGGFSMLRAAVELARKYQFQSVKALKSKLELNFPGREQEITEALAYWGKSLRRHERS